VHSGAEPPARPDPYGAMLRGGIVPAVAVGVVALAVFTAVEGALGAAGAALAVAVVLASTVSTLALLRRMAGLDPRVVFLGAMVGYFSKVGLLGVFLLVFRNAEWLSPLAFAVTAIVVSLAGTIGEVVAFTKVKTYIYDEPAPAPEARR
jgi:ATP synthase protein I